MSFIAKWEDFPAVGNCSQCREAIVDALRSALPTHRFDSDAQGISTSENLEAEAQSVADRVLKDQRDAVTHVDWHVSGMDCGACVAKIETALGKCDGVSCVDVSMMRERVTLGLDNADRAQRDSITRTLNKLGYPAQEKSPRETRNIEGGFAGGADADADVDGVGAAGTGCASGCCAATASAQAPSRKKSDDESVRRFIPWSADSDEIALVAIILAMGAFVGGLVPQTGSYAMSVAAILAALPIMKRALRLAQSGSVFSMELLMSVAVIGAVAIGESVEAGMVVLLFAIGERLEAVAAGHARKGVKALMKLAPEQARRICDDGFEVIPAGRLVVDDVVEVRPGERVPADGIVHQGAAEIDNSHMTGESVPAFSEPGAEVFAGAIVTDRPVEIRVTRVAGQTMLDRVIELVEESEKHKAPVERFVTKFARIYTPVIMMLGALTVLVPPLLFGQPWEEWIYRGLALLLIGCPCALVISTPAAVTSALARATKIGLLVKGGAALEAIGSVRTMAFDKTGTLTEGKPKLVSMIVRGEQGRDAILSIVAGLETMTSHPLARAVVRAAEEHSLVLPEITDARTMAGAGVEGRVNGTLYRVGAATRLDVTPQGDIAEWLAQQENAGCTSVVVLREDRIVAALAFRDMARADAADALAALGKLNIMPVMLTGDATRVAKRMAADLGMEYRAELLPEDKLDVLTGLRDDPKRKGPIAMVGDGINDAPALKAADVGIAIGGGTDIALEAADAVAVKDRLGDVVNLVKLSRAARRVIRENITIALGLKLVFLVTSITGLTGLWLAVLADTGATVLVTINSLRLLVALRNAK